MDELNKRLENIEKEYILFHKNKKEKKVNNFDYKEMINQNIIETEHKSNKLNSFLTDNEIYNQKNELYDFNKKDDIFQVDKETELSEKESVNKMNDLVFTNYKKEIKNDIMNQQTGNTNGFMELPYLKEGFTKNKKFNKSMIMNSRLNNYTPIGRSINKTYDKASIYSSNKHTNKDLVNERLNKLNPMTSKNPFPLKYENKVSDITKQYLNYDTQSEKELNTYYKNNQKIKYK